MSLTIQQIITDAKRLAARIKERDNVADVLLNETHAINKKIDAMKQVCKTNVKFIFFLNFLRIYTYIL